MGKKKKKKKSLPPLTPDQVASVEVAIKAHVENDRELWANHKYPEEMVILKGKPVTHFKWISTEGAYDVWACHKGGSIQFQSIKGCGDEVFAAVMGG